MIFSSSKMTRHIGSILFLFWLSANAAFASSITVGVNNRPNAFPFGGPVDGYPGTRYQEAYASSNFPGPISITGIDFFLSLDIGGNLYAGTYQLSLSTITADINGLSDTNFNGNLGPNNVVFDTVALSGPPPPILSFTGGPFKYDPADGNLLLDIQIFNPSRSLGEIGFQDGGGFGPAGVIRYHNFGGGTTGYGLVTQFNLAVPEPQTLVLVGCALVGLVARRLHCVIGTITKQAIGAHI